MKKILFFPIAFIVLVDANAQNVGIGTTTPNVDFHIHGSSPSLKRIQLTHSGTGTTLTDGLLIGISAASNGAFLLQNEALPLWFGTSGVERMRINEHGKVSIGPYQYFSANLSVTDTSQGSVAIYAENNHPNYTSIYLNAENPNASSQIAFLKEGLFKTTIGVNSINNFFIEYALNKTAFYVNTSNGNVGIGNAFPTAAFDVYGLTKLDTLEVYGPGQLGALEVDGFTKLGVNAPAIKVKKIAGTLNATETQVAIPHFLNFSKILSVSVLVEYATGAVPSGYTVAAGYEYNYHVTGTNIAITPATGNCANILSKNFKVMITYEE